MSAQGVPEGVFGVFVHPCLPLPTPADADANAAGGREHL